MNENFNNIGNRISQRMKEMNLIQKELSEKTNISKNAISNYINNLRIPKTAECFKISQALLVSMEWLLTGSEHTKSKTMDTSIKAKEVIHLTENQYNSIVDKKGMTNEIFKASCDELTQTFECTERERNLISAFRSFDELDKEMIENTMNMLIRRLEKNPTLYTYTPGDEEAAAEESAEYTVKKHA